MPKEKGYIEALYETMPKERAIMEHYMKRCRKKRAISNLADSMKVGLYLLLILTIGWWLPPAREIIFKWWEHTISPWTD